MLAFSLGVYAATLHFDWNLPGYPDDKVWFFNPMAWQVVFYSGAVLAVIAPQLAWLDRWRWTVSVLAVIYLAFAAFIALSWHYNSLERLIPDWIARQIYPIDKTNLDILRFVHFLALAWLSGSWCGQTPNSEMADSDAYSQVRRALLADILPRYVSCCYSSDHRRPVRRVHSVSDRCQYRRNRHHVPRRLWRELVQGWPSRARARGVNARALLAVASLALVGWSAAAHCRASVPCQP